MDDLVAQFTAITGAEPQRAAQYLTLADGNLEQAVQMFFDIPNLDLDGSAAPQPPAASEPTSHQTRGYTEDPQGIVHIDSDEEDDDDEVTYNPRPRQPATATPPVHRQPAMEDDEAIARRLQEEMYGGGGVAAESVRAPMARTTETLVGPGSNWGAADEDDMQAMITEQLLSRQRRGPAARPGIFNQRPASSSVWEESAADPDLQRRILSQSTAGASDRSSKSSMLAEMYRPPFELISRLPWDEARDEGKSSQKWLLVNVQDPSVFDCQLLNRDIWKHEQIRDTIKENFLFMQYNKDDPRGAQYIQYYFPTRDVQSAYPHIAIVDPRTGEQVKVWSGPPCPKPMEFLMQLHEFLDRYSLRPDARNPVATRKAERRKELDVERMTEDEMMELALRNSMAAANGAAASDSRDVDPDELTRDDLGKGKQKARLADAMDVADMGPAASASTSTSTPSTNGDTTAAAQHPSSAPSPFALISASRPHEEPPNDPAATTRIQFRYSGGRQIRRFALNDPVRRMYEWLKASPIEGKEGLDFELVFMGKNLIDDLERSIGEVGLKNGTVMVEFNYD